MKSTYALFIFLLITVLWSCKRDSDVLLDRLLPIPPAPIELTAFDIDSTSFQLSWAKGGEFENTFSYRVYLDATFLAILTDTTLVIRDLEPIRTYEVFVMALSENEIPSEKSPIIEVTTLSGVDMEAPAPPPNLSASTTTVTGTELRWAAATDNVEVTSYTVYQGETKIASVAETSFSVTGLSGATQYAFTVTALDADGNESAPSSAVSVRTATPTDTEAPTTPSEFSASNTTVTGTALQWAAATDNVGVTSYSIYQGETKIAAVAETSYSVTGLNGATQYTFTVTASDADGNESAPSSAVSVRTAIPTDTEPPMTPSGLLARNTTAIGTELRWSAATDNVGVVGYNVYQGENEIAKVATTSFSVTGLSGATLYIFTVTALDADGNESPASSAVAVRTTTVVDTQAPTVPSGLAASNTTETGTALSWSAATDNIGVTGYKVYQGDNEIAEVGSTTFTVTDLSAATSYTFTVSAFDAEGNTSSRSSAVSVRTTTPADTQAPTVPSGLAASSITETGTVLSWSAATDNIGVTGYKVYQGENEMATVTGTTYTVTGLSAATTYAFSVSAFDAEGNTSSRSSAVSARTTTPADTQAPTVPSGLAASGITETGTVLSWSAASDNVGVTGYKVYQGENEMATVTGTTFTVKGLSAATTYAFSVSAFDAEDNESMRSSAVSVTTTTVVTKSKVLVFTKTSGFNHNTKTESVAMVQQIAANQNFDVDVDDSGAAFNSLTNLNQYAIIFFTNTTGNTLNQTQRTNVEGYAAQGGSFISNHAASDSYGHSSATTVSGNGKGVWDWYAENVTGCSVRNSPNHTSNDFGAIVTVENQNTQLTTGIGFPWNDNEEWYYWEGGFLEASFIELLRVSDTGDETFDAPRMTAQYWERPDGGSSFYSSMGHAKSKYSDADFMRLMGNVFDYMLD